MSDSILPVKMSAEARVQVKIESSGKRTGTLLGVFERLYIRHTDPVQIVERAKAKSEAQIIEARTGLEIKGIQERAWQRLGATEVRRQENLEAIAQETAALLPSGDASAAPDDDWMAEFFNACQDVGNHQMRRLWARLLAGQVASPGRFSRRTLATVRLLDSDDAKRFAALCQFTVVDEHGERLPIINHRSDLLQRHGLNFGHLKHLANIGLISFEPIQGYAVQHKEGSAFPLSYQGIAFVVHGDALVREQGVTAELWTGDVIFSQVGDELAGIVASEYSTEIASYLCDFWAPSPISGDLVNQARGRDS